MKQVWQGCEVSNYGGAQSKLTVCVKWDIKWCGVLISLSLGDQITTTLATSVLPVCSEENS